MKKFIYILFLSSLLISCNKTDDVKLSKDIIGKWYFNETFSEDPDEDGFAMSINMEGTDTYIKNNSYKGKGIIRYLVLANNQTFAIDYKYSSEGKWRIENGNIFIDNDLSSLNFIFLKTDARSYNEKEFVRYFKQSAVQEFKSAVAEYGDEPSKIISLTKNTLEIKDLDGEITKLKKN